MKRLRPLSIVRECFRLQPYSLLEVDLRNRSGLPKLGASVGMAERLAQYGGEFDIDIERAPRFPLIVNIYGFVHVFAPHVPSSMSHSLLLDPSKYPSWREGCNLHVAPYQCVPGAYGK